MQMRMRHDAPAAVDPDEKWFGSTKEREHRIDGVNERLFFKPTQWDEQTKFSAIDEIVASEER
ncbi:hypothetical protein [Halocatena marina]